MNEDEKWRWVPEFEGLYLVSNQGRVMGMPKPTVQGHIMRTKKNWAGYVTVCLSKNGKKHSKSVHRLVAAAFIPNPESKEEVNHINGKRDDNRVENLEWCTRSENERHAYTVLGKKPNAPWRGKPRKFARKLTDDQVRLIRRDTRPRTEIAKEYGVSKQTIEHIQKERIYKEVTQ